MATDVIIDFSKEIRTALDATAGGIRRNLKEHDVNATYALYDSFEATAGATAGSLTALDYLANTETGTAPGAAPNFYAIRTWAIVKLNLSERIDETAGSIRRNIAARGSQLFQKGGRDTIFTNVFENEEILDTFGETVGDNVFDMILGFFDEN